MSKGPTAFFSYNVLALTALKFCVVIKKASWLEKFKASLACIEPATEKSRREIKRDLKKARRKFVQADMQTQKMLEQQQSQIEGVNTGGNNSSRESQMSEDKDEEMTKSALTTFRAKEEEIEKKKLEVREKVRAQLGRVEEETKRLAVIREELEALTDPMRKDVSVVRKKIDAINRELKPLGQSCQKKEKEYKEVLEAFNEKNKEKAQLITRLMELVGESERMRMKKLEELSKNIDSLH
ncbi:hypothetical protein IFM89_013606 [Coptis chinensis]|uniref:RAB6-interacting golgin n=1 Tax=Coptis chinensis TaxID=261450 RepID=A0A835HCZ2_9MAGN|nr:hypothetical protein IFM89_013606 [Coptis chinensis]